MPYHHHTYMYFELLYMRYCCYIWICFPSFFPDICLKSNIGIADSLYNLTKVKGFCLQNLPWNIFHLTYEDFLYTHNNLKQNLYALIADLFYWFEIDRAPGVIVTSKEEGLELIALFCFLSSLFKKYFVSVTCM